MNVKIMLGGVAGTDITATCKLSETRINYDSTRRLATASLTIMGSVPELSTITILDASDGTTKLFEGKVYAIQRDHSDGPTFQAYYRCELNDHSALLDRAVCATGTSPILGSNDKAIITSLLTTFCPGINVSTDVAMLLPSIGSYEYLTKTCRQVLDDLSVLSAAEWRVDFNAVLHYHAASAAPAAPFNLSTTPDLSTTFPVLVSGYKRDFHNPVNTAYVRGATISGVPIVATYADPVSVSRYGTFSSAVVDDQITLAFKASLRAQSMVVKYAYPIESGNFTIWKEASP